MYYFDKQVQETIAQELKLIKGNENKDDARQEAYLAIADENPINIDEAVSCARRAVGRYRKRLLKEYHNEISFADVISATNSEGHYIDMPVWERVGLNPTEDDIEEYEPIGQIKSRIDRLFLDREEPPNHSSNYYKKYYKENAST